MPPRLIVNADDFGLTAGINRAIVDLFEAGAISSATLMATAPASTQAIALALRNPGLGIGCHLTFVDGVPVSHPDSIPTLLGADGKCFRPSYLDFVQALLRGTIDGAELAREAQAQIQQLQRAGLDLTHVDTHKHLHCFPLVFETVCYIAGRCGVAALRNPFEPAWSSSLAHPSLMRRLQLAALPRISIDRKGERFREVMREARALGVASDGTLGIAATGTLHSAGLRTLLTRLCAEPDDAVYELCCHPGHVDDALRRMPTRLLESRAFEYHALREVVPEFTQRFSTSPGRPLIHYGELGIPGLQRASGQFSPFTGFEKVL